MTVSGAGNYAVNAMLARWLTPEEFGDASLLVTLLLMMTALAGCFQLVSARYTSAAVAGGDHDGVMAVRLRLTRTAWTVGGALGLATALGAERLADLFTVGDPTALAVFGLGLPLFLAQAVERGILQGRLAFGRLAGTFIVEMVVRVALSCGLVAAGWGLLGVSTGLWASLLASLIAARVLVRPTRPRSASYRAPGLGQAAGATTALLVAQITIGHGDLLLVKQRFSATEAGVYAVVALLGRAVYLGSWSLVTAVYPLGARAGADAATTRRLVRAGVALLAAGGTVATIGFWVLGEPLVRLLFSDDYAGAGSLLGPYVLATSLLAVANLLAMVDLAAGRHRRSHMVIGAAVAQSLLVSWSGSLQAVVWAQAITMALLVAAMSARSDAGTGSGRDRRPALAVDLPSTA
jgi:O-antigen/teichoic acid export membrane protein